MTKEQFITLLRSPATVNLNLVNDLEEITERFPYFQNAHLLLAKQYQGHENIRYESYLRKAAAYAPDRTLLYRLIKHQPVEVIHMQGLSEIPVAETDGDTALKVDLPAATLETETEQPIEIPAQATERVPEIKIPFSPGEKSGSVPPVGREEIPDKQPGEISGVEPDPLPAPATKGKQEPAVRKPVKKIIHDQHTFTEWLRMKSIPVLPDAGQSDYLLPDAARDGESFKQDVKPGEDLIDRFIRSEPRIVPAKSEFYSPGNMARQSAIEHEDLISETLARIYARQGNIPKAIDAYRRLSLKLPEKSGYFAALIRELEEKNDQE